MKRLASLSISAAFAASLIGCSQQDSLQRQQCQKVAQSYSQWLKLEHSQSRALEQHWQIDLRFQVKSALGPQLGQARCEYALLSNGQIAALPYAITLGKRRHSGDSNIQDLINGRYSNGEALPEHHH